MADASLRLKDNVTWLKHIIKSHKIGKNISYANYKLDT